ncbi:gnrr-6 [Pristionchus pacificus]|uniref:Gnrr-6 n=1 Tax=Pristionchus pacificus TaxID=54126 RepID=A0A454XXA2_PRIPA|nr:gnrr-6 [Pristionchus pacificus]|eukprot:PDM74678.1 gnrr-6 [Pristionchus pacificus]
MDTEDGNASFVEDAPPERLPSDTVQLVFLLIVLIVGLPSNCLVFSRIMTLYKASHKDSVKAGFLLLKLNLAITDLMLLFFYALPKLLWNITYEWKGTDSMCKTHNYLSMASYYLSSNIIVCIALDRLRTVLGASKIRRGKSTRSIRLLIFFAWFFAFAWSLPQFVVFQTVDVLPNSNATWIQCSDVWTINTIRKEGAPPSVPEWILQPPMQAVYELTHLLLVFWGPLVALSISYVIIAIRLARFSMSGPQSAAPPHLASCGGEASEARYMVDSDEVSCELVIKRDHTSGPFNAISSLFKARKESMMPRNRATVQPMWRRRLRGKLFRSTLLIVAAHFMFWFPYNFASLVAYLSIDYKEIIAIHAYFLNDLQILITLVNPMLYAIVQ